MISKDPSMKVVGIHIGADHGGPVLSVTSVRARAGMGLEGDRHFHPDGDAEAGEALTLVEEEVVESVGLEAGGTRRQVTVRGVRVNDLIGRRFRVGDVECYGVELCEPCLTLERNTRPGIIKDLVHRAGINADILTDGTIAVGDQVVVDPA
jgi:MOSC domain-containing protein YiiM